MFPQKAVLVVDAGLQKINIVTWQRAFKMLYAEKKDPKKIPVVREYSRDGSVVGGETKHRMPKVIQLADVIPIHRRRARFCRKNVIGRDRGACQYCGRQFPTEDLTLDHVIPRVQGGHTTWENTVASCILCNQRKAGRTPAQAGMKLIKKPVRPTQFIDITVKMDITHVPVEWRDYWSVTLEP